MDLHRHLPNRPNHHPGHPPYARYLDTLVGETAGERGEAGVFAGVSARERRNEMFDQTLKDFIETLHARAKKLVGDCPEARKYMEKLLPEAFESKVSDFQHGNIVLYNDKLQFPKLLIKYNDKAIFIDFTSTSNTVAAVYSWDNRQGAERSFGYKLAPDCNILIKYRNGKIVDTKVWED